MKDFQEVPTNIKLQWNNYIIGIINEYNFSDNFKQRLIDLLKSVPKITVSNCKKLSEIEANELWKTKKSENRDVFSNLFQRIYNDLEINNIDYVLDHHATTLNLIAETLHKNITDVENKIRNLSTFIKAGTQEQIMVSSEELKDYYQKFVIMYKQNFIDAYIDKKLQSMKEKFTVISETKKIKLNPDKFIDVIRNNEQLYSTLLNYLNDNFDININNIDFDKLIIQIINKDDSAYKILNIDIPQCYIDANKKKSIKRLMQNYLPLLKEMGPSYYPIIVEYLNDPITKANLKNKFTKNQQELLTQIISLMKESSSEIYFEGEDINFNSVYTEFNEDEKKIVEIFLGKISKYNKLKEIVNRLYNEISKSQSECNKILEVKPLEEKVPFDDANYILDDYNYIFQKSIIKGFIDKLNEDKLLQMDDYTYFSLKDTIIPNGLLATILYGNFNLIDISSLVNNYSEIFKSFNDNCTPYTDKVDLLSCLLKKNNLYKYIDNNIVQALGYEVADKIINNNQFVGEKLTEDDIRERIAKAYDLHKRSQDIKNSTIPYDFNITNGIVTVCRYHNNDPKILISGIDTNACFKLSSNENDFMFYTVLSENGFVIKFIDNNGKLLARASGIRRNNILELNGIRPANNSNIISSKEQYYLYNNILDVLDKFAEKMIEITSNDEAPIDFVVCNKASILESPEFNDKYEILNNHLFSNPIDIYSDDWIKFVHTYDGKKNYLKQATEDSIFTTDFGSYPVVMIKSRQGKTLERLSDISYDTPKAIYKREDLLNKYSDDELIDKTKEQV